jgi:hypothetical protein
VGKRIYQWVTGSVVLGSCGICLADPPSFTVSGSIDGSGVMPVNPDSVSWDNLYFQTPTALNVNGTAWDPATNPSMDISGPLVPSDPQDYFVSTDQISGRGIANAQIVNDQVMVFYADTPNGSDNYQIQVSFTPKPPPVPSPSATIQISGMIDGTDVVQITNAGATWIHEDRNAPTDVTLNGIPWDTVDDPTLPNSGATTFLPAGVDLSTVQFTKDEGRDTATYQLFSNSIDVYFGDNPSGSSQYSATLAFGSVPEPAEGVIILAVGAVGLMPRRAGLRTR